jgi:dolichol-phosphate mannosyltransferase
MSRTLLSVVVPLLNEQDNLRELHRRLVAVTESLGVDRQLVFVDDGSTDRSAEILAQLATEDRTVEILRFSRNFGHEAASTAGLDHARGDAVVLIDADLQDPPELIADMVRIWRGDGAKIVYARRRTRAGEGPLKRFTSWLFYRLLIRVADVDIPTDTGDFRLIDRSVADALRGCREHDRFIRGLVAWTGFKAVPLLYDRAARHAGETKYRPLKLLLLSFDAIVGFSITPLRIATLFGFFTTLVCAAMAITIIVQKLVWGIPVQGYAALTTGLFFIGGVQMLLLGILGEYVGRIYRQSQNRPLYLVQPPAPVRPDAPDDATAKRTVIDSTQVASKH